MSTIWRGVERVLWCAFLVLLPIQTRLILYQADWQFIEWRSISLFGIDLLWGALFVLWGAESIRHRQWPFRWRRGDTLLVIFALWALLTVLWSPLQVVSGAMSVALFQGILLFWYVRERMPRIAPAWLSAAAVVAGGVWQSVLGLAQWALQRDVGLRLLGEPVLSPAMRGVAVFVGENGERFMRAYGTFPHPNVLAWYLLVASAALGYLYLRMPPRTRLMRVAYVLAGALLVWALCATFARTALLFGALAAVAWAFTVARRRAERPAVLRMFLIVVAAGILFAATFWSAVWARAHVRAHEEAVQLRIAFAKDAVGSGGASLNWFGVGEGSYVTWLLRAYPMKPTYLLQPAHNVFLLMYAELGVVGVVLFLGFFAVFLRRMVRASAPPALFALLGVLVGIAFLDHYYWTLQQGRFLFWGVLALGVLTEKDYFAMLKSD